MRTDALPTFKTKAVHAHLDRLSREPFRDVLAVFLGSAPSAEAIKDLAECRPDRWGQGLVMLAKLAGYHDKLQVDHSHIEVAEMSDMELMKRFNELQKKLAGDDGSEIAPLRLASQSNGTPSAPDAAEDE